MASLIIKSEDKAQTSQSSNNFVITLNTPIEGYYKLTGITMFNTVYNVVSGVNNIIYTTLGNATIPAGYYDGTTFTTAVQTALQAVSAGFTASLSTSTFKLTITHSTTNFQLNFSSSTGNDAALLMGFTPGSDTALALTATGSNVISLVYSRGVIVRIAEADTSFAASSAAYGTVGCLYLPLNSTFGSLIDISEGQYTDQIVRFRRTGTLSISLFSETGQTLSLNGVNWTMMFKKLEC